MGDDDDGALKAREGLLEKPDRGQVEVIGRLVEQQHVGSREQELRQLDPHQPAAAEARERTRCPLIVEAQTREDRGHPRVAFEAARQPVAMTERVVAFGQRRGQGLALLATAAHLGFDLGDFRLELVELGQRRSRLFSHAV